MISLQADDAVGCGVLKGPDRLDHTGAIRAAVDVIAKKDKPIRVRSRMRGDAFEQVQKKIVPPVDIADRVGQFGHSTPPAEGAWKASVYSIVIRRIELFGSQAFIRALVARMLQKHPGKPAKEFNRFLGTLLLLGPVDDILQNDRNLVELCDPACRQDVKESGE